MEVYKVTQADVDVLREFADAALQLYSDRKATQSERSENTSHITVLFNELRSELKMLDKLVEGYVTDKEMLGIYFFARRIYDVRSGSNRKPDELDGLVVE